MTDFPNASYKKFSRYYQSLGPIMQRPKSRTYTAIIFSFLAIALFALYAIRPTIATIIYLRKEIADKTTVNNQMEQKIANLIEAQAAYQEIQPLIPIVKDALPENPDAIGMILQLRNLANETGATISAVRVSATPLTVEQNTSQKQKQHTTKTSEFTFSFVLGGTYTAVTKYLEGLTTIRRIISIESLNIQPEGDESGRNSSNMLKLTVQLKSFYSY